MDDHILGASIRDYLLRSYAYVPALISSERADTLAELARKLPGRMVRLGEGQSQTWEEKPVEDEDHPLHQLVAEELIDTVLRVARSSAPESRIMHVVSWVTRYGPQGFIPRHRDQHGSVQIIVSLAMPPPENGGALGLRAQRRPADFIQLRAGDSVVFNATEVEHWTRPLVPTENMPMPERLALVGRYYID